jgi:hypothetical protein
LDDDLASTVGRFMQGKEMGVTNHMDEYKALQESWLKG